MKQVPAKRLILVSLTGTAIVVVADKASSGVFPGPRIFLGIAVVYVILGFMADFAPMVAGPLAVLVFLSVLLTNGGKALQGTQKALARSKNVTRLGSAAPKPARPDRQPSKP